jgi:hypothetical protein
MSDLIHFKVYVRGTTISCLSTEFHSTGVKTDQVGQAWSRESVSDMRLRRSESQLLWDRIKRKEMKSEQHLINRANNLGLKGWVRNNPDESVEGAAVGPTSKLNHLYVHQHHFR